MKVSELKGFDLNYWVAQALGWSGFCSMKCYKDPETGDWSVGDILDATDLMCAFPPETDEEDKSGEYARWHLQPVPEFSKDPRYVVDLMNRFVRTDLMKYRDHAACDIMFNGRLTHQRGDTLQEAVSRAVVEVSFGKEVNYGK